MEKKFLAGLVIGAMLFIGSVNTSFATPVFFEINAGGFGYETSWSINQLLGGSWSIGMSTGSMGSGVNYTYNWDLDEGDYRLAMDDTYGDGLDAGGHAYLTVNSVPLLSHVGNLFNYSYTLDFAVPRSDSSIPEPATMLLFGTGLLGLAGISIRRKRK